MIFTNIFLPFSLFYIKDYSLGEKTKNQYAIYILRKNYCINPNLNVIFIKKSLYNEEKKYNHYILRGNIGNGMILCDNNINVPYDLIKNGDTNMTKLSNYIEFLSTRNLALIKIDVEGSEGRAIKSGIELLFKIK